MTSQFWFFKANNSFDTSLIYSTVVKFMGEKVLVKALEFVSQIHVYHTRQCQELIPSCCID